MTPLQAIKQWCYECSGENRAEVDRCTKPTCPLYPFRKGHNPYTSRAMTDEQREAAAKRLKEAREKVKTGGKV